MNNAGFKIFEKSKNSAPLLGLTCAYSLPYLHPELLLKNLKVSSVGLLLWSLFSVFGSSCSSCSVVDEENRDPPSQVSDRHVDLFENPDLLVRWLLVKMSENCLVELTESCCLMAFFFFSMELRTDFHAAIL